MLAHALLLNSPVSDQRIGQITSPLDQLRAIAPHASKNHILWFKGRKAQAEREWYSLKSADFETFLSDKKGIHDFYFTPNEFRGWRKLALLEALNAFYVDIDLHDKDSSDPTQLVYTALDALTAAGVPTPNLVVHTGRGAHIYWLFNRTPRQALPRWKAVQRQLVEIAGGDRSVVDATRVLRFAGTINSAAAKARRSVLAETVNPERYDFDWLCDQIIKPRAEIHDIRRERERRRGVQNLSSTAIKGSIYQVWEARFKDLCTIANECFPTGIGEGYRNDFLLHLSCALSWHRHYEDLESEVARVASNLIPDFTESQVRNCVQSVMQRAKKSAAGQEDVYDGKLCDFRYRYASKTLWDFYAPLVNSKPGLLQKLTSIIPPELRGLRRAKREAGRDRVAEGRYKQSRSDYLDAAGQRKADAIRRFQAGESIASIAQAIGVTRRSISSYVADAKSALMEKASSAMKSGVEKCTRLAALLTQQAVCSEAEMTAPLASLTRRVKALLQLLRHAQPQALDSAQLASQLGTSPLRVDRLLRVARRIFPNQGEMSALLACGGEPSP